MIVNVEDPIFDFASIEADILGERVPFVELTYDSEMDGATQFYAFGRRPIGTVVGREKPTAAGKLTIAARDRLLKRLGPGFTRIEFPIFVKYSMPGFDIVTDTVARTRIIKPSGGGSGTDGLTCDLGFLPRYVLWNGIPMIGDAAGNP